MSHITLPRAVGEKVRSALSAWVRIYQFEQDIAALAALDAALKEPEPKPVVVEQLFALANLTVRRAADPDPWVWDRLDDDGTWMPFNPLIHGPDMWRLEQALRAALAKPDAKREPTHPGYIVGAHWLETAYSRIAAGEAEAAVLAEVLGERGWVKPQPATMQQIAEAYDRICEERVFAWQAHHLGWRDAEEFHGIVREDGK